MRRLGKRGEAPRVRDDARPMSLVPSLLTVGLAVVYVAAVLNANPKQPTAFTTFLARVIYPIQPHGYLPKDMIVELGTSDSGLDANGVEWVIAAVLNVGVWVGVIAAVAILSYHTLDRRSRAP